MSFKIILDYLAFHTNSWRGEGGVNVTAIVANNISAC